MKFFVSVLFVVFVSAAYSLEDCPPGEYRPGLVPGCGMGLEPICPSPAHTAMTGNCLACWCIPGTYRVPGQGCVESIKDCPRW